MNIKRVRQIYGSILSVALVAAGICLMGACLSVYHSGGEQIYTAEKIAAAFAPISVPVYLALALVIGGFILHIALPQASEKQKPEKNHSLILHKLHEKNDLTKCGDSSLRAAIEKQQKLRKLHSVISLVLLGICALVFLVYALDGNHFDQNEITESMVKAMWVMIPCLAIPFGYAVFTAYFHKASIRKEIDLMKLVAAPRQDAPSKKSVDYTSALTVLRFGLLGVALCLLVLGLIGEGWADVLTKAVNICRECVGLG